MNVRRSSRIAGRGAAIVAAFGLFAVACGGGTDDASVDQATADASADTNPVEVDQPATVAGDDAPSSPSSPSSDVPEILQFSSPLVGGGELDAASLAGTPTAFWFWAPT